ncbi:hypothetical protein EYF80_064271 [Liparis tanakae]|uniref:Uncharacterized protein n=1 Tax=Liparis tanakae TaxID=230148 RepID=A0A4Z2E9W0_9TELE|nr:hypothetical protein EYF80_064271 [Liparis tanakae]
MLLTLVEANAKHAARYTGGTSNAGDADVGTSNHTAGKLGVSRATGREGVREGQENRTELLFTSSPAAELIIIIIVSVTARRPKTGTALH